MKKAYFSPMTSLLMSLSLVVGIFVAGLTNSHMLPTAKAQIIEVDVTVQSQNGRLIGTVISAQGVVINGVATNVMIPGGINISNTVVNSSCGVTALGYTSTGEIIYALGVFTSGNDDSGSNGVFTSGNDGDIPPSTNGVFTSGNDGDIPPVPNGVFTSGNDGDTPPGPNGILTSGNVYVGDTLQVVGGVLSGTNIQVTNGVVSGSNLKVTGGYVTSVCGN